MAKHVLIDGDIIVYRCGFAAEKTHYVVVDSKNQVAPSFFDNAKEATAYAKAIPGGDLLIFNRKEVQPLENCLQMVKTLVNQNILELPDVESLTMVLSGKRNFREDLYPEYKANRASAPKPKYYMDIRNYLVRTYGAVITDGIEADDEIGIRAAELLKAKKSFVVASSDKDLKQIPGEHYDFTKGETWKVSNQDSVRFFYQQLLSGDATDNIPGLKGIGPIKALAALDGAQAPRECAARVCDMYVKEYAKEATGIIERNATLLWIWRKKEDKHPFWKHLGRDEV